MQILIAWLTFATGTTILTIGHTNPITDTLPTWLTATWPIGLTLGGALLLLAAAVRNPLHGLYLELLAHLPLATLTSTYACGVIVTAHGPGIPTAGATLAATAAFAYRWRQCRRILHELHRPTHG